jgi:hypothetical protein
MCPDLILSGGAGLLPLAELLPWYHQPILKKGMIKSEAFTAHKARRHVKIPLR